MLLDSNKRTYIEKLYWQFGESYEMSQSLGIVQQQCIWFRVSGTTVGVHYRVACTRLKIEIPLIFIIAIICLFS